jgi:hypothetical protein
MIKGIVIIGAWFLLFNIVYSILGPREETSPSKTILNPSEQAQRNAMQSVLNQQVHEIQQQLNQKYGYTK